MKNLTDLPENTIEEIREKIHCYLSERQSILQFIALLQKREYDTCQIIGYLVDKSAKATLAKHKIKPIRLSLD